MSLALELRDVSFGYGDGPPVLRDVDLAVKTGELVAIAGPNGGGKTTLVRIALGLERPDSGTVSLFGEPAHRFSRRATLGYLAQRAQLQLDAPATVEEVVSAGRLAAGGLLGPLRRRDRASSTKRSSASAWHPSGAALTGSPAASSSGHSSPKRWPATRRCSCSTSRPRVSTSSRRKPSNTPPSSPHRAVRDRSLRFARVRGNRALCPAAGARSRRHRLRRAARGVARHLARPFTRPCLSPSSCGSRSQRASSSACSLPQSVSSSSSGG